MSRRNANASDIRRVVTALDAHDRSTTLFDDRLTLMKVGNAGAGSANLWATDSSPAEFAFADDGAKKQVGFSPPDNGTSFRVVEFAPVDAAAEAQLPHDFMMRVVGDHAPRRGLPSSHPLMHRTRSVDYAIVVCGEIDLMLDDKIVHLQAGDVVVQQATNHAWLNHGTEPCRVIFVLIDSKQP